jgi:putative heme-binding domain-containing protein
MPMQMQPLRLPVPQPAPTARGGAAVPCVTGLARPVWLAAAALLLSIGVATAQDGLANPHEGNRGAVRAGRALFETRCAECHGADAKGISGPDLTVLFAAGRTDGRVFQTIQAGIPGSIMPSSSAPDDELWAIVSYLKSLGTVSPVEFATGNADQGRQVFTANCAGCHRAGRDGGRLGPDLSRITLSRSRAGMTAAIRDPSDAMRVGYRTVTVVTSDGERIQGLKKAEDAFSIQIVDTSERLQGYLKADLRAVQDEAESLMPPFGPDTVSDTDLDNLLRFLTSVHEGTVQDNGAP